MTTTPHYTQSGSEPVVTGDGPDVLMCRCGASPLIAGYDPRLFLAIAIKCAACDEITETPPLPLGVPPPPNITLVERGTDDPPRSVPANTVLISRKEMWRLTAIFQPRQTDTDRYRMSEPLLDSVEAAYAEWRGQPLTPRPESFKSHALAWAVAHFRTQLRDPLWTHFVDDTDLVAMTVIVAFLDLCATWSYHPLFSAILESCEQQRFSFHSMALPGAAKALMNAGNRLVLLPSPEEPVKITGLRLLLGEADQRVIEVMAFDQFEWPNAARATPAAVRAAVLTAVNAVQGRINRLHPGILIFSSGASAGAFDQMLTDAMTEVIAAQGKRHRGLAALAAIFPKATLTGNPAEAGFTNVFYPVANRNHSIGEQVQIGARP